MVFEVGKFYKHKSLGGRCMHVVAVANTVMYGEDTLLAEDTSGEFIPLCGEEWACENYVEISKEEFEGQLDVK